MRKILSGLITKLLVLSVIILFGTFFYTLFISRPIQTTELLGMMKDKGSSTFPLLAPSAMVDRPTDVVVNFLSLRQSIRQQVAGYGNSFGLYFEYLETGVSIGVNKELLFNPDALIEVPLAMALYQNYENRGVDSEDAVIEIKENIFDHGSSKLLQNKTVKKVNLGEMIQSAFTQSDLTASRILANNAPLEDYKSIYSNLDIDYPSSPEETFMINTEQYASILKALYFSSILNKNHSQMLLEFLTTSNFDDKLVAGIPKSVKVAHITDNLDQEVHKDCGIVYYPNRPYLLCMVSESSEVEAQARMKLLSENVYAFLSSANSM